MSDDQDDYKVGYKKPPLANRIRPGERRNPKGRPKGSRNVDTILSQVMDTPRKIRENGKERKVTTTEVVVLTQIKKATEQGDTRAAQYLLDRKAAIDAIKSGQQTGEEALSADAEALLEEYISRRVEDEVARRLAELGGEDKP